MKIKILWSSFVLIFFVSVFAYAHKPIFENRNSTFENPIVISNHRISSVVYGELKNKDDVDFVKFSGKRGEEFFIEMAIPRIKGNEDFKPYIALIGKEIMKAENVSIKLPKDYGVIVIYPVPTRYFYEKFTGTSYNISQCIRGEIPSDGDYYVAIFSMGSKGKYSLTIGEKEKFSFIDIIKFPFSYLRIKSFFNPIDVIFIFAGAIIIIVFVVLLFKKFRR